MKEHFFKYLFLFSILFISVFLGALSYRYQLITYDFIEYLSKVKNRYLDNSSFIQKKVFKPHRKSKDISFINPEDVNVSKSIVKNKGLFKDVPYLISTHTKKNGMFINNKLVKNINIPGNSWYINQFINNHKVLVTNLKEKYVGIYDLNKNDFTWKTYVNNPHHWSKANENYVFVNTRIHGSLPRDADTISKKNSNLSDCIDSFVQFDQVTVLNIQSGKIEKKFDLFELISKNDLLKNTFRRCGDPFHLNHIEPINDNILYKFPNAKKK